MMLLPLLARTMAAIYYRMSYAGAKVPQRGPVLLVANHPNSLLDPMLVLAAAGRQVRFLAKSTLFPDPKIGWLVKAAGAIPVYRQADDPSQTSRNDEMFRAVHDALACDDAVGIFPEGISHSGAALAPLKTGVARIALGAAPQVGDSFPIIPIGLVFRQKDVFRSEALVLVGSPIEWTDMVRATVDDAAAVRELTQRVANALSAITVNLDAWQDQPIVETAVAIWEAAAGTLPDHQARIERLTETTRILRAVREHGDQVGERLANDLLRHGSRLARLRLSPADLSIIHSRRGNLKWAARRLPLVLPFLAGVAGIGWLLFWIPYRLTGAIVSMVKLDTDARSTWKLMIGMVVYSAWVVLFAVAGWYWWGAGAMLAALVLIPLVGMLGLLVREGWYGAWQDVRRFMLFRSRRSMITALRTTQHQLAERLDQLYHEYNPKDAT